MDSALFARSLEKGTDAQQVNAELNPGVSPVHVLTLESEHPEYRYLRLERSCGSFFTDAADAANISHVGLRNPAGSGTLVVVQRVVVLNTTAGNLVFGLRIGVTPTVDVEAAGFLLDTRFGPTTQRSTALIFNRTSAAIGNQWQRVAVAAGQSATLDVNVVLGPGGFITVNGIANNVQADASFRWWERSAEAQEIQGSGV